MCNVSRKVPTPEFVRECVHVIRLRSRLTRVETALKNIHSSSPFDFEISPNEIEEADTAADLWELADGPAAQCEVEPESSILKPPPGTAWARVRTNFSLPEDYKQEFYVPYLGEEDEDMDKSSSLAREIMDDDKKAEEKEKAVEWFKKTPYFDLLGSETCEQGDDSDAENELLDHSKDRTKESYARGAWDRAFKRRTILGVICAFDPNRENFNRCVELLSKELNVSEGHVRRYFSNACYRGWRWSQSDNHEEIMSNHRRDLRNWIRNEKRTETRQILASNSVGFFYCRRCNIHDCDLHGCGVDLTPKVIPYDASRKECMEPSKRRELEQACQFAGTINCYAFMQKQKHSANGGSLVFGNGFIQVDLDTSNVSNNNYCASNMKHTQTNGVHRPKFEPNEVIDLCSSSDDEAQKPAAIPQPPPPPPLLPPQGLQASHLSIFRLDEGAALLLEAFRVVLGNDYCRLALAINITGAYKVTCTELGSYLADVKGERLNPDVVRPPPVMKPPKPNKFKQMRLISVQENRVLVKGQRLDYTPCNHEGPCTKENCSCVKAGLFCEKYCRCCSPRINGSRTHAGSWCRNIFPYCRCKPGHCKTENCDCVIAKRECDPDHCGCHCGGDKKCDDGGEWKRCHNVSLRNNETARIVCGHSVVHGWGAYACAPIKKGSLIGQYTGEIISEGDGERRGRVYDQKNLSFLFDITPEWVVDSTRLGNKLRHLNHSRNFNCEAKIVRVDGNVLVGIFAAKDIQAWEELLFNYGYDGKTGPEFARCNTSAKRPKRDCAAMKSSRRRDGRGDGRRNSQKKEKENEHEEQEKEEEDDDDGVDFGVMEVSSDDDSNYEGDKEDADDEDFCPGM